MNRDQFLDLAKSMVHRAANADFLQSQARDDERQALAEAVPPVTAPQVQDYLAWRRAVLWVSGILMAIVFLLAAGAYEPVATVFARQNPGHELNLEIAIHQVEQNVGEGNLEMIDGILITALLLKLVVAILALLAARHWSSVLRTRYFARCAFALMLVVPLLLFAFPWTRLMDFSHLAGMGEDATRLKQALAMLFGTLAMLTLAPKLLSLFPGVIRASLTLKTLLPEAAAPGWVAVIFAPLFLGFLLLVLCMLSQLEGNLMVILAFALLAAGPWTYLRRAKELVQPHDAASATVVIREVRKTAMLANVLGVALLVAYLLELETVGALDVAQLVLEAMASVLLTMVVFTDTMLALLRYGSDQGDAFQGSELQARLRIRYTELTEAGLTDTREAFRLRRNQAKET